MRRIIERKVTVVTTTTWTITWEADPPPTKPEADPMPKEIPDLEALSSAWPHPSANDAKEANLQEPISENTQQADKPSKDS